MDPLPDIEVIPQRIGDLDILQLKVNAGSYTPYYYVGNGQRIAFTEAPIQIYSNSISDYHLYLCRHLECRRL